MKDSGRNRGKSNQIWDKPKGKEIDVFILGFVLFRVVGGYPKEKASEEDKRIP